MKNISFIILLVLTIVSCSKSGNFSVEGTITNSPYSMVHLDKLEVNGTSPFDSAKIDNDGNFKLSGDVSYPTFFLLRLNNQKFITLLVDSLDRVKLSADYLNLTTDYKISGSKGSEQIQELNQHLAATNAKIDSLQALLNMIPNTKNNDAKKDELTNEIHKTHKDQQDYSVKFINDNPFSMASVLAIYQKFNNGNFIVQDIQTLKVAASALNSMYPESVHAQTLYRDTEKLVKHIRQQQLTDFINEYGKNSPDIVLPDKNGKDVSLSSIKSKVVLLQFWSVADKNSRVLNEVLKENYKQFKQKGFEIYQVSVDTDKDAWKKAITEDQMTWINVGDMQGSVKALHNFNIHSVPANYLIDRDGTIVARNIKGPEIHRKLSELLN